MKKMVLILLIMAFALNLHSGSDLKLKKKLSVSAEDVYPDSIIRLGGEIDVKGVVEKSIVMIGGQLNLDGEVREDVICFGSDVRVGKNAWIKGELLVIGGNLDRNSMSRVNGEFFYFRFDLKKIESTLLPIISDSKTITFLRILKIIFWLILTLVVLAIFPQKINQAQEIFNKNVLKIGMIGMLTIFAFLFLLIIFIVLTFLIIGIPLLLALILSYFLILIFGRTVMFLYIGSKISSSFRLTSISPSILLLIGVVFYSLLKFLPYAGPLLLIIMNIVEIGIGIGFIFRKRLGFKN
jgi:hypothetical protein